MSEQIQRRATLLSIANEIGSDLEDVQETVLEMSESQMHELFTEGRVIVAHTVVVEDDDDDDEEGEDEEEQDVEIEVSLSARLI